MNFLRFCVLCLHCWRSLRESSVGYHTLTFRGVPQVAMFVARDREAWRVVQFAVYSGLAREPRPWDDL